MAIQLTACVTSKAPLNYELAQKMARKARQANERAFCAYRCQLCGCWHIGSHTTNSRPPGPLPILKTNHQAFLGARS